MHGANISFFSGICPSGLKEGFIRWDDEQSEIDYKDKHFGDLPDGNYEKSHTTINYCCSTKGNVNNPIQLPALKPFYLLTYDSAQCQKVAGTKVTSEFIKFDDDDQGNTDAAGGAHPYGPSEDPFNLKIYYCYYEPGKSGSICPRQFLRSPPTARNPNLEVAIMYAWHTFS